MNKVAMKSLIKFLLLANLSMLVACGDSGRSSVDYLTSAKSALANNELKAAIINLKNAIKQNSNNAEARWMLGQVYLEIGNGNAAENELSKAVNLGITGKALTIDMFNALLMQKKYNEALKLIEDFKSKDASGSEELTLLGANVLFEKGDIKKAKKLYLSLSDDVLTNLGKFIGLAKVAYTEGDKNESSEYLVKAKNIDKNSVELLFTEAELLTLQSKYAEAEQLYSAIVSKEQVRQISKRLSMALIGLIKSQIAQNKIKDVKPNIVKLETLNPKNMLLKYIKGIVAFREGKYSDAQTYLLEVIKVNKNFTPALLLLATSNFALANYEQTAEELTRYLAINPGHVQATKLLATTQIRLNQPQAAVASLNSIADRTAEDVELISLLGQAVLQSGDVAKGQRLLQQAADAGDRGSRLQLASVFLSQGDAKSALHELNKNETKNSPFKQKSLVVLAHLQNKDYSRAELETNKIIKATPDDARAYNLLGTVFLFQNERSKAEKQFRLALEKNPKFYVAWKNIAAIHMGNKDFQEASKAFKAVLDINEKDIDALLGLANISEKEGNPKKAISLLTKARKLDPKAEKPRITLGTYYMRKGLYSEALEIEKELAQYPNPSSKALAFRGALLLNSGSNKSIDVYKRLTLLEPNNYFWYYRQALALMKFNQQDKALPIVRKATLLKPEYLPASSLLVSLETKTGNFDAANTLIKKIRRLNSTSPAADSLSADIAMIQKDYKGASKFYKAAFVKANNNSVLLKYLDALDKAGKSNEVIGNLDDWLSKNPKDLKVRVYYAYYLNRTGKTQQSIGLYREMLKENEKNVVVLNDLANVLYKAGDKKEAKKLAEQAYQLAPGAAEIGDTLGWILFREGDVDKSYDLIKKASDVAPTLYEIKYHLAEILVKTNRGEQARKILTKILDNGGFDSENAAKKLLKSLK